MPEGNDVRTPSSTPDNAAPSETPVFEEKSHAQAPKQLNSKPQKPAAHVNIAKLNNLAVDAAREKDWQKATDLLKQALNVAPETATSYENLQAVYRYQTSLAYQTALSLKQKKTNAPTLKRIAPITDSLTSELRKKESKQASAQRKKRSPLSESKQNAVTAALNNWALAWSNQDIDEYITAYVINYTPTGFTRHSRWKQQREKRIKKASDISVEVKDISLEALSKQLVLARFKQRYASQQFNDTTNKQILLRYDGNTWKIAHEEVVN